MKSVKLAERKKKTPAHLARAAKDSKETTAVDTERRGYACQLCGARSGDPDPFHLGRDVRILIEIIVDESKGGRGRPESVRMTCSNCKEGMKNISLARPANTELIKLVSRARIEDQRHLLDWLEKKFEGIRPRRLRHPSIFDLDVKLEHE
jgi:hypothetical protein